MELVNRSYDVLMSYALMFLSFISFRTFPLNVFHFAELLSSSDGKDVQLFSEL